MLIVMVSLGDTCRAGQLTMNKQHIIVFASCPLSHPFPSAVPGIMPFHFLSIFLPALEDSICSGCHPVSFFSMNQHYGHGPCFRWWLTAREVAHKLNLANKRIWKFAALHWDKMGERNTKCELFLMCIFSLKSRKCSFGGKKYSALLYNIIYKN